jgi:hypothetical protein
MADKEFLLGVKARELLKYTKQATKVVSDDISPQDVRAILHKIAALEDIRDAREVCSQAINAVDRKQKEGFTKTAFRFYGQDMREIAKQILLDVHAANNTHFLTEYDSRLHKIDAVLDGCSLLLEYITLCMDEKIISTAKGGVWTGKVMDVKRMAGKWRKNDGGRAKSLRDQAQAVRNRQQIGLVKEAIRQYKAGE